MALLELKNLNKRYGKYQAMADISFSVGQGRIVGLIGPNGAGKSTTMRAITGLMPYDSGRVVFDNQLVTAHQHQALDGLGNLIEYPAIYPNLTARQHLKLYMMDCKQPVDIDKLMKRTQIDGPKFQKRKAKKFSLGMKQRLGIAIALLRNPKLVILDEPTNGLDPQSVHDLREFIRGLADEGVSFLISSHLLDELQKLIDDIVVINNGKIIHQSTMADFFNNDKLTYTIGTDDNVKALALLQEAGWQATVADDKIDVTGMPDLQTVISVINMNGVNLISISEQKHSLEKNLLEMLAGKKGDA